MVEPLPDASGASPGSSLGKPLLVVFALGSVILVAVVGILGYRSFFALKTEAREFLDASPAFQAELGQVESLAVDWTATDATEGSEQVVFDVVGTRGPGRAIFGMITLPSRNSILVGRWLELPDGRKLELTSPEGHDPERHSPGGHRAAPTPSDADPEPRSG